MARDKYHNHAKEALEKDGWKITDDPFYMSVDEVEYEVDLGAEELVAAEKDGEIIAVEIKSFLSYSHADEYYQTLGRYVKYKTALEKFEPNRTLYLAVSLSTHNDFFQKRVVQNSLKKIEAKIVVYEPTAKNILKWIK